MQGSQLPIFSKVMCLFYPASTHRVNRLFILRSKRNTQ